MNINAIINEEIVNIFEQNIYGIKELSDLLMRQGFDGESRDFLQSLLVDAYQKDGNQGVIDTYEKMTGVQINALSNGKYTFARVSQQQGISEINPVRIKDGVADRYAEKAFNIPDERKQQDVRAMSGLQMEKEKPFAFVGRAKTPVFKNPKSLENIQVDARAIADEYGDVYVAQSLFSMGTHGMMGEELGLVNDGELIYQPEFLLLHFNGNNDFIFSDSAEHYDYSEPEYHDNFRYIISRVKIKNPEYKIITYQHLT